MQVASPFPRTPVSTFQRCPQSLTAHSSRQYQPETLETLRTRPAYRPSPRHCAAHIQTFLSDTRTVQADPVETTSHGNTPPCISQLGTCSRRLPLEPVLLSRQGQVNIANGEFERVAVINRCACDAVPGQKVPGCQSVENAHCHNRSIIPA